MGDVKAFRVSSLSFSAKLRRPSMRVVELSGQLEEEQDGIRTEDNQKHSNDHDYGGEMEDSRHLSHDVVCSCDDPDCWTMRT